MVVMSQLFCAVLRSFVVMVQKKTKSSIKEAAMWEEVHSFVGQLSLLCFESMCSIRALPDC